MLTLQAPINVPLSIARLPTSFQQPHIFDLDIPHKGYFAYSKADEKIGITVTTRVLAISVFE